MSNFIAITDTEHRIHIINIERINLISPTIDKDGKPELRISFGMDCIWAREVPQEMLALIRQAEGKK